MKTLKIIFIVVAVLAAILFVGGLFLPKTYSVSRSITINAPDDTIYYNIADFNNFLKWNPWYKMEPSAKVNISGTVAQPGHKYAWKGEETGMGQMIITKAEPSKMVDIDLKFIKPFESSSTTKFIIEPESNSSRVTWSMSGENKSTLDKWMGLCMDKMIGGDFESGLKSLKEQSEK